MRPSQLALMVAGQLAGVGMVMAGFWLLYLAFLDGSVFYGIAGGMLILGGMLVMARSRRAAFKGGR